MQQRDTYNLTFRTSISTFLSLNLIFFQFQLPLLDLTWHFDMKSFLFFNYCHFLLSSWYFCERPTGTLIFHFKLYIIPIQVYISKFQINILNFLNPICFQFHGSNFSFLISSKTVLTHFEFQLDISQFQDFNFYLPIDSS